MIDEKSVKGLKIQISGKSAKVIEYDYGVDEDDTMVWIRALTQIGEFEKGEEFLVSIKKLKKYINDSGYKYNRSKNKYML